MKNFIIFQKLNYSIETKEKQLQIDTVTEHIRKNMLEAGYSEAMPEHKKISWVFSIGGDGTMLHCMHTHVNKQSIVVGVNAGNFGFLTPYSLEEIFDSDIVSLIEDKPRIEKRSILAHSIHKNKGFAVNEYTLVPLDVRDMLDFFVEIEHNNQISKAGHYNCFSLVISGPCGSTAYNMNVGGAIIDPVVQCMQIVMMAPTSLGVRPLIISKNSKIRIKLNKPAKIFSDGVLVNGNTFDNHNELVISLIKKESQILVPDDWNFFDVLAKKLHWNNGKKT